MLACDGHHFHSRGGTRPDGTDGTVFVKPNVIDLMTWTSNSNEALRLSRSFIGLGLDHGRAAASEVEGKVI